MPNQILHQGHRGGCVFFCFLSETERRGVHREDRGGERRGPGEGLLRRDRAHAGQQDEVGEGEEAEGPVAATWCPAGEEVSKSDSVFSLSPASG